MKTHLPKVNLDQRKWHVINADGEVLGRLAALVADTPLRRFGAPEEVAAIAVLLAGDESAYVTGAEFHVDGGLLAGSAAAPRTAS